VQAVCCAGSAAGHSVGRIPRPLSLGVEASAPASSGAILPEQALVMSAKNRSEEGRWWRMRRTLSKERAHSEAYSACDLCCGGESACADRDSGGRSARRSGRIFRHVLRGPTFALCVKHDFQDSDLRARQPRHRMRRVGLRNNKRRGLRRRGRWTHRRGRWRGPRLEHPRQCESRQRVVRLRKEPLPGRGLLRASLLRRRSPSLPARARQRHLSARNHVRTELRRFGPWMHARSVHACASVLRIERRDVRAAAARHARCELPLRLTYFGRGQSSTRARATFRGSSGSESARRIHRRRGRSIPSRALTRARRGSPLCRDVQTWNRPPEP
jgi:hypothetical protein